MRKLGSASPLPTLAAVLARYDLEPGDEVRIDAGSYAGSAVTEIDGDALPYFTTIIVRV